ncbi:MAG: lysoplasmalogenase [Candidatus Marinimicrobia bacterium]|nr:lysoplasmalogenase [Candidatus Neomarinimicrobiota bacterium]
MRSLRIIFTILTACSAIITIRAEYLGPSIHIYVFKPLTMVFILLIAIQMSRGNFSRYVGTIIVGLIFSLAGDVFLMLPSDQFIAGLVSFLVAHLFYIVAFTTGRRIKLTGSGLPFLLYGVLICTILYPYLEEMKLPVLAYVLVILIMGWQACDRYYLSKNTFTLLAFVGAVLFIFSDSILALNKFREPFEIARALNLSTYFIAQWMIAFSVKQKLSC